MKIFDSSNIELFNSIIQKLEIINSHIINLKYCSFKILNMKNCSDIKNNFNLNACKTILENCNTCSLFDSSNSIQYINCQNISHLTRNDIINDTIQNNLIERDFNNIFVIDNEHDANTLRRSRTPDF